ncbi:MAG: hypothetical protein KF746_17655 [Chitinophagaceae bacterium]|nr:hypothetical protein [Chitinophagaceae bacterium]
MCKTTKGTQAAAGSQIIGIQPNTGGVVTPPTPAPPANQFDGFQEHVPDVTFISTAGTAGFLQSARQFYGYFGLQPRDVNSIEHLLQLLADPAVTTTYQRMLLVSHAHPRGVIMPFFTGGVNGTNKEVFREFAKSDLDGLKYLDPFDPPVFNWSSVFSTIMGNLRTFISANAQYANALNPFGLQTSGTPSGTLRSFFEECFNHVFIGTAGRVRSRNGSAITPAQRTICTRFKGAILTEMGKGLVSGSVTATQVNTLREAITHLGITNLNVDTFQYTLSDYVPDNMNYYPTLDNAARAVAADFRANLNRARQRFAVTSTIDIRGCRAGDDSDYLVALREFFDRPQNPRLRASAPIWFQSYPPLGWERPRNRADIAAYLTRSIFANAVPPAEQRSAVLSWAGLIKVEPLHTAFWTDLLSGHALRFCDLTWRTRIPALFIPTPGLASLSGLAFAAVITNLTNYFNVPAASVPSATQLTGVASIVSSATSYSQTLFATPVAATLQSLFTSLQQINTALSQNIVPATAPNPLTIAIIQQYQQQLLDHLATQLTPVKNFMQAAQDSLQTGDGLYYYMLFAGLPVFFFNRNAISRNGLMVLQPHDNAAMQSWYKCIWAETLPSGAANQSTGAAIGTAQSRRVPMLQDDHVLTELAICPSDRYGDRLTFSP